MVPSCQKWIKWVPQCHFERPGVIIIIEFIYSLLLQIKYNKSGIDRAFGLEHH